MEGCAQARPPPGAIASSSVHGLPLPSRCHALDEGFHKEALKSPEQCATHAKKSRFVSFLSSPQSIPHSKNDESPRPLCRKGFPSCQLVASIERNRVHFRAFAARAARPRKKP